MGAWQCNSRGVLAKPNAAAGASHVGTTTGADPASVTIAYPVGTAVGDIGVVVACSGIAPSITSGYTLQQLVTFGTRTRVYTKTLTSGDLASGVTFSDSTTVVVQVLVVHGGVEPTGGNLSLTGVGHSDPEAPQADPSGTATGDVVFKIWTSNQGGAPGAFGSGSGTKKAIITGSAVTSLSYSAAPGATGLSSATGLTGFGVLGSIRVPHV